MFAQDGFALKRLVQISHPSQGRRVAVVEGSQLRLLDGATVYEMLSQGRFFAPTSATLDYDSVYLGRSDWRLLLPIDHPEPARCLVAGTGLTHRKSAQNRNAMHEGPVTVTDSMKMYQWGEAGGKPAAGEVGTAPEWFYKGPGTVLRAHDQALDVPGYAGDGGEEAEVAGLYFIGSDGTPIRIGFAQGNEFSDHITERKNYLYLAPSKLRTCSIGPELILRQDFGLVKGVARVERRGVPVWEKDIATGEEVMCHSLENLEHHHFKYEQHRRPGDLHVHFYGAGAFSFGDGVALEDGDIMHVEFEGFGKALRNPLRVIGDGEKLVRVKPL